MFFFPFLFPSCCHSIVCRVVRIVSDGCNLSSFVFIYVVFELWYWCINAVFDAGKYSSSLFSSLSTSSLGCNTLCIVISFLVLWSIFLSSSLVYLRKGPSIYSFDEVPAGEFWLELFSCSPEIFFLNLVLHFHMFDGVSLQGTQVFVGFIFSERYYYYYFSLVRAFYISVSRWFFTGVWVTANLLKSPRLFLVFWPFSVMLSFGWSPLVRQLPSPPVPLVIL